MTDVDYEFGDIDPDDSYDSEDANVSWDNVEELATRFEEVEGIEDDEARLAAAKALVMELG